MLGDFCYAAINGLKGFLITQGQAVIIGTGLVLGLIYVFRQRYKTRNQKFLDRGSEMADEG
jgi:hypothetical protein